MSLLQPVLPVPREWNPIYYIVPHLPTLGDLLPVKLPNHNVVKEFFEQHGFEVILYEGRAPVPFVQFMDEFARVWMDLIAYGFLTYAVYHASTKASQRTRDGIALGLIAALYTWPFLVGLGSAELFNFLRPAIVFRSSLLLWDIFHIRTTDEVLHWGLVMFLNHLYLFPVEDDELRRREERVGHRRSARYECAKDILLRGIPQALFGLPLLWLFPPGDVDASLPWLKRSLYHVPMAFAVFFLLSAGGIFMLGSLGFLCNIEQMPMFENPFFTTRLRIFWSRWNRAIATVLHRVIFGGRNTYKTVDVRTRVPASKDSFFDTDGADSTNEGARADGLRKRRVAGAVPNGTVAAADEKKSGGDAKPAPRRKSVRSFVNKAIAAVLTFFVSGLFHEYLLLYVSPCKPGLNTIFFVLNGFGTVLSSGVERFFPNFNAKIPPMVRYMVMVAFYLAIAPLFFAPFSHTDFFSSMQRMTHWALPTGMERPKPMFVYIFGK
ncbi:hypothetical protein MSPP1_001704 [Malassezia sp. CBS 17886]|nr:hypothetical protein MSPP1_001704 [Malassezia sp. CBS 17886]